MDSLSIKNYDKNKLIEEEFDISLNIEEKNKKEKKTEYNYYNTNLLNKIFFTWSKKTISISNKRKLKINDINDLHEEQKTKFHINKLLKEWEKYYKKKMKNILY
jgi:hypothetical protein